MNEDAMRRLKEAAVEDLAAAWYRANAFRKGGIPPLWRHVDHVIQRAYREAATSYVNGRELTEPSLRMVRDEWVQD